MNGRKLYIKERFEMRSKKRKKKKRNVGKSVKL
jgi:hypothetical protein